MDISSANGPSAGSLATNAQAERLLAQAQNAGGSKEKEKIEKAGKDFESILLGSWLGDAEKSFAAAPGGDEDGDDGGREQFMGIAMQQLAGTLAASGGIGLARMITSHLEAAAASKTAQTIAPDKPEKARLP